MTPIVRNKKTNDLYQFLGGNRFRNIRTGTEGDVSDEAATANFLINAEATLLVGEYPIIAEMIRKLNLKFEK